MSLDQATPYIVSLGWLLLMLGPLLFSQRWLHREIQMVFLLVTRSATFALGLFSLLFFPGVLLHEFSHFIMAQVLMVRTGKFSLIPQLLPGGQLRLGYVETVPTDWVRDALIGAAPLLSGGAVIAYLGSHPLGLTPLALLMEQGQWGAFWQALSGLPQQADFWLWFYLAFAISSTMLPSASDRHAWLPLAVIFVLLFGIALLAGAGPWMIEHLAPPFNRMIQLVTTIFGISLALHLILLMPVLLLRLMIERVTGLRIVSQKPE